MNSVYGGNNRGISWGHWTKTMLNQSSWNTLLL